MTSLLRLASLCAVLALAVPAASAAEAAKKDEKKAPAAAKPVNKVCPVEGGDVDPAVTVEHKGKTIGFCCAGCDDTFKKEPAKYMAVVDKELKESAAKDKDKDKKKGDGKDKPKDEAPAKEAKLNTKCPVTGDDVDGTLTSAYKGRTVALCCEDCVKDFEKDPKKYVAKLEKEEGAKGGGKSGEKKKDDAEREKDGKSDKPTAK